MADSPEESSWTFYIEGFICDTDSKPCLSSDFDTPSLISDAASSAVAKKFREGLGFSSSPRNETTLQNNFKKQKTKIVPPMDYDLEDTASSPVNSPKVKRNSFGRYLLLKGIVIS